MGIFQYTGGADKNTTIPLYVTRKNADGIIATWSVGLRTGVIVMGLGGIAATLWLAIAVVEAVLHVIGWF